MIALVLSVIASWTIKFTSCPAQLPSVGEGMVWKMSPAETARTGLVKRLALARTDAKCKSFMTTGLRM